MAELIVSYEMTEMPHFECFRAKLILMILIFLAKFQALKMGTTKVRFSTENVFNVLIFLTYLYTDC